MKTPDQIDQTNYAPFFVCNTSHLKSAKINFENLELECEKKVNLDEVFAKVLRVVKNMCLSTQVILLATEPHFGFETLLFLFGFVFYHQIRNNRRYDIFDACIELNCATAMNLNIDFVSAMNILYFALL